MTDEFVIPEEQMIAERLAYEDDVRRDNERFRRLSDRDKRVAIAHDVIAYIKCGKLVAQRRVYIGIVPNALVATPDDPHYETSHFDGPTMNGHACICCGVGAIFAAAAERKLVDLRYDPSSKSSAAPAVMTIRNRLRPYFSNAQLGLIESAFEMSISFALNTSVTRAEAKRAVRLGDRYSCDSRARMLAIMRNIIRNRGTFRP